MGFYVFSIKKTIYESKFFFGSKLCLKSMI